MTPQEIWESAFVAPDGTRWIRDGRGGIVPLQSTTPSGTTPETERRDYILKSVKEMQTQIDEGKLTLSDAVKKAAETYDAVVGSTSTPTSTEGGEETNFDYSEDEELAEAKRRGLIK